MKKLLIRFVINFIALYLAVYLLNGSGLTMINTQWVSFLWLALIFGLVNAIIRPIVKMLTCPLIILTLGLGTLVINALMFFLAGWIGDQWGIGFTVTWWGALLGALIVSVVSLVLSAIFREGLKEK
ncbi:MAG TPA: phage holin family protein [Anaerolineaceae bacterium]